MGVATRPGNGDSLELADWSPLVDITETDQEYLFKADRIRKVHLQEAVEGLSAFEYDFGD